MGTAHPHIPDKMKGHAIVGMDRSSSAGIARTGSQAVELLTRGRLLVWFLSGVVSLCTAHSILSPMNF